MDRPPVTLSAVAPIRTASPGVVALLESYLASAKAGDILGVLVISSQPGGFSDCGLSLARGAATLSMIGQLHFAGEKLAAHVHDENDEVIAEGEDEP